MNVIVETVKTAAVKAAPVVAHYGIEVGKTSVKWIVKGFMTGTSLAMGYAGMKAACAFWPKTLKSLKEAMDGLEQTAEKEAEKTEETTETSEEPTNE